MVIPVPAILFVQCHDQKLFVIECSQQLRASRNSRHRMTKLTVKLIQNGRLKQELDDFVGLGCKRILDVSGNLARRA